VAALLALFYRRTHKWVYVFFHTHLLYCLIFIYLLLYVFLYRSYPNPRSYKKYGKQRSWMRENKAPETETSPLDGFQKLTDEECRQMQFPFEM